MPSTTVQFDAILFDMDGTLIDSTAGVEGAWGLFAEKYPGLDIPNILSSAHGVRTVESLRKHCGIEDPDELEVIFSVYLTNSGKPDTPHKAEAQRFEEAIVTRSHENGKTGLKLLPGVREIIDEVWMRKRGLFLHFCIFFLLTAAFFLCIKLAPGAKFPKQCWTICTSATRAYASQALPSVGINIPDGIVYAEDVEKGKPQPDPYLLGAKRCGFDPKHCLVVEDAPAGVCSGLAAGCKTLALVTSHSREQMVAVNPDFLVDNLASVTMKRIDNGVLVTITTP
ncbi:hypothetical protein EW146_g7647 [Bondarzewia mesenterica]|uniref:Uncharacterized protein n=1 Tax=Bondarzewia mesenterica TaxID=1095465 RepID=A0A4V3XE86_9AGAM|nr:hypothetical protein EW146_g7647 [Bondarzewia mesenterica]